MSAKWQRDQAQLTTLLYQKQAEHTAILSEITRITKDPVDLSDVVFRSAGDTLSQLERDICQLHETLAIVSNICVDFTQGEE